MYTKVYVSIGAKRHCWLWENASHRVAYIKTLRAIERNEIFENARSTRLLKVKHPAKNYSEFLLHVDNCRYGYINLITYEH